MIAKLLVMIDHQHFKDTYQVSVKEFLADLEHVDAEEEDRAATSILAEFEKFTKFRYYPRYVFGMAGGDVHFFYIGDILYVSYPGGPTIIMGVPMRVSEPERTTPGKLIAALLGELYDSGTRLMEWSEFVQFAKSEIND